MSKSRSAGPDPEVIVVLRGIEWKLDDPYERQALIEWAKMIVLQWYKSENYDELIGLLGLNPPGHRRRTHRQTRRELETALALDAGDELPPGMTREYAQKLLSKWQDIVDKVNETIERSQPGKNR